MNNRADIRRRALRLGCATAVGALRFDRAAAVCRAQAASDFSASPYSLSLYN